MKLAAPPFIRSIRHRLTTWASIRADLADASVRDCVRQVLDSAETSVTRVRFLARGGGALVFRAIRRTGEDVALKVPRYRARTNNERSAAELALRREADALGIVRVSVVPRLLWRSPTGHCFLRELVEGTTVAALTKNPSLPLLQRREFLLELLATSRELFNAVHKSPLGNFVLRDFKPRNLVRNTRDGRLILIDLGALRREGTDAATKGSVCRLGMGKWKFWAPEQLLMSEQVDCRADYFALAATSFAILTSRSPYTNLCAGRSDALRAYSSEYEVAAARLKTVASAIGLSGKLTDFLTAALNPDVEARPSTFDNDLLA